MDSTTRQDDNRSRAPSPVQQALASPGEGYDSDDQCDCNCDCARAPGDHLARPVLPLSYYLELTPECNNRCPGCGNIFVADAGARTLRVAEPWLTVNHWRAVLDTISGHVGRVQLTGGEPTCHPHFAQIVDELRVRRLPFTLFSNGRWPGPEGLIHTLQASGQCRGLLISLHGATAASHEAFSGVAGSFEETCQNIALAARAGLVVAVSTVFTRQNFAHIGAVIDLAVRIGAQQVVFNRYLGRPVDPIALSESELRHAVATVEAMRAAGRPVKFGACIPGCFTPSSAHSCGAGVTFATIDPWGNVRPCNHSPLVLGNLLRQPMQAIWFSPELQGWEALLPRQCRACELAANCRGGCRAVALQLNLKKDPLIRRPMLSKGAAVGPVVGTGQ